MQTWLLQRLASHFSCC